MVFDEDTRRDKKFIKDKEVIDEVDGSLQNSDEKNKLMKSVMESKESEIDMGKVLSESLGRGFGSFTPDLFFEHLVNNFSNAERMYGDSLIREITGYSPDYIKKNAKIPEFKRELDKKIKQTGKELQQNKIIDKDGDFSKDSIELASLLMLTEELDKLESHDMGHRINVKGEYGVKGDIRTFRNDKYKNLSVKQSIKTAIRRGHKKIMYEDLRAQDLNKHSKLNVIYALDTSGSMMGDKLNLAKRAGIALSWKSIKEKNEAGLIVFNAEIKDYVPPCKDIKKLLEILVRTKASSETDLAKAIDKGIELLSKKKGKKHLLLVTDGMPTKGKLPITNALEASSRAMNEKITVSIVGIGLEEKGEKVAKRITEISRGKLYSAKDSEELDSIVLEDYYDSIKAR